MAQRSREYRIPDDRVREDEEPQNRRKKAAIIADPRIGFGRTQSRNVGTRKPRKLRQIRGRLKVLLLRERHPRRI